MLLNSAMLQQPLPEGTCLVHTGLRVLRETTWALPSLNPGLVGSAPQQEGAYLGHKLNLAFFFFFF